MSTIPTLNNSVQYSEAWLQEATARAQRKLVTEQLRYQNDVEPFNRFRKLLGVLLERAPYLEGGGRMLEVGCGVGHYGVIVKGAAPFLHYTGTDLSPYMVEARLDPDADLRVAEFLENDFGAYDVVLLSQVLEMTVAPRASLEHALANLKRGSWLMLHRLRQDDVGERVVHEPTYGGLPAHNFVWDLDKLLRGLWGWGKVTDIHSWADRRQVSLLFQKNA